MQWQAVHPIKGQERGRKGLGASHQLVKRNQCEEVRTLLGPRLWSGPQRHQLQWWGRWG